MEYFVKIFNSKSQNKKKKYFVYFPDIELVC